MKTMRHGLALILAAAMCLTSALALADDAAEIEFFSRKSESVDLFNEIFAMYEEGNPGVKVTQTQVPDAATVLYSRMASGDLPDILGVYPNESDFRLQAAEGYYMDLTGSEYLKNINESFLSGIEVDGKSYSIPMTVNGWGIFYNKTKFDELGLKAPATWDELKALCEAIKAAGYIPMATSFKEGWTVGHLAENILLNLEGAEAANALFADSGVKMEDSALFQKMVDWLDFFEDNSQPDSISTDYSTAVALFSRGEALMLPQGIWALAVTEQAGMQDEIAMFPMPNYEGNGMIQYGIDLAFSIAADTQNPEQVQDFVAYLTSTETAQYFADREKSPSTINGVKAVSPQIEGVTSLLYEEGRSEPWLHFNWASGVDGEWQQELASYFVLHDRASLNENLDEIFGK